MRNTKVSLIVMIALLVLGINCKTIRGVDYIYYNGHIVTMNEGMPLATVMVIKAGVIEEVGDSSIIAKYTCDPAHKIDLKQQIVYPAFIDAHCHFYGYAKTLMSCNLVGSGSWDEVLERLDSFARTNTSQWITGRGWDQNDWEVKEYPTNASLNAMFPDRPVILKRIDGHAAICNARALSLAGITEGTQVTGGELLKKNGHLTGVLVDNAVDLVEKVVPKPSVQELTKALQKAEAECYSYGLTTLADAGLELPEAFFLDSLGREKQLSIFLYIMLNPTKEALIFAEGAGPYENSRTRISSFKLYADGSLGSRGARLKHDYCDRLGHAGMFLNRLSFLDSFCSQAYNTTEYQVNTHCIGDSANKKVLEIYGAYLKRQNERAWRIEHAQIIDTADVALFRKYSVIPSVQPTHATSDASWVEQRLCKDRLPGAYAYKLLLAQNGFIALGTDFPVEYINPLYTFYSAVYRESATNPGQPAFLLNESLTPEQAIKGMTIWAAKACQLGHRKGQLVRNMDGDFIILNQDILKTNKENVLKTRVLATYRRGVKVYSIEN